MHSMRFWALIGLMCLFVPRPGLGAQIGPGDRAYPVIQRLERDQKFIQTVAPTAEDIQDVTSSMNSVLSMLPARRPGTFQSRHPVIDAGTQLPLVGGFFGTAKFVMVAGEGLVGSMHAYSTQDRKVSEPVRKAFVACDRMLKTHSGQGVPGLVADCSAAVRALDRAKPELDKQAEVVSKLSDLNQKAIALWSRKNHGPLPATSPLQALAQSLHSARQVMAARKLVVAHERQLFADVARLGRKSLKR